jgi:hypothetical protein
LRKLEARQRVCGFTPGQAIDTDQVAKLYKASLNTLELSACQVESVLRRGIKHAGDWQLPLALEINDSTCRLGAADLTPVISSSWS